MHLGVDTVGHPGTDTDPPRRRRLDHDPKPTRRSTSSTGISTSSSRGNPPRDTIATSTLDDDLPTRRSTSDAGISTSSSRGNPAVTVKLTHVPAPTTTPRDRPWGSVVRGGSIEASFPMTSLTSRFVLILKFFFSFIFLFFFLFFLFIFLLFFLFFCLSQLGAMIMVVMINPCHPCVVHVIRRGRRG